MHNPDGFIYVLLQWLLAVEARELALGEAGPADIEAPPVMTSGSEPASCADIQLCEGMNQPLKPQGYSSDLCHAQVCLALAVVAK
jgi:hypothetical protein